MNYSELRWLNRDSVGIRTQDPQLRRLLLYPTELPNRSLFAFENAGCDFKWVAKVVKYFVNAKNIAGAKIKTFLSQLFLPADHFSREFDAGHEEETDEGEEDGAADVHVDLVEV